MKCQNCGAELPNGAKFCKDCGKVQVVAEKKKKSLLPLIIVLAVVALGLISAIVVLLASRGGNGGNGAADTSEPAVVSADQTTVPSEQTAVQTSEPRQTEETDSPEDLTTESPSEETDPEPEHTTAETEAPTEPQPSDLPDDSHSELPTEYQQVYQDALEAFIHSADQDLWWNVLTVYTEGPGKTLESASFYQNFYSYDTSIAEVKENGIVTGKSAGTTYVVADKGVNRDGPIQIHVFKIEVKAGSDPSGQGQTSGLPDTGSSEVPEDCLDDIEAFIHSTDQDLWWNVLTVSVGESKTLESASYYENFYSYDTSIAEVQGNGIVTGKSAGTTYIVADKGVNAFGRSQVHVFKVVVEG